MNSIANHNGQPVQTPLELAHDYRIIGLLGEGANGKTWLAKKLSTEDWVAIKALKMSVAEDLKSIELFKREAMTLQSLEVNGVPRFYESIFPKKHGDVFYIIQEYIRCSSVAEFLKNNGRFSEVDTLIIMEKLASILMQLQTRYSPPIIHRDIKPSNILFRQSASDCLVYLIDFGAVANPQKRGHGSTIAGTFGYMAPEQLLGDVSIQTDFYAVGATMLHMLTGVAPYQLSSDVFKLQYESVLNEKAPETSPYMKQLLSSLLAPEAEKRPESASELMRKIHCVLTGRSPNDKPQSSYSGILDEFKKKQVPAALKQFMPRNWKLCEGLIRKISAFWLDGEYDNYLEFTFKVQDTLWAGVWPFKSMPRESFKCFSNVRLPIKCTVGYNPTDPRLNCVMDCTIFNTVVLCYRYQVQVYQEAGYLKY